MGSPSAVLALSSMLLSGSVFIFSPLPTLSQYDQAEPAPHSDWVEDDEGEQPEEQVGGDIDRPFPREDGSLKHSEHASRLDERLFPGKVLDPLILSPPPVTTAWFRIPEWMAGRWRAKTDHVLRESSLRVSGSGFIPDYIKAGSIRRFGMQREASGAIWQFVKTPHVTRSRADGRTEYRVQIACAITELSPQAVLIAERVLSVRTEDSTGVILESHQQECYWLAEPVSPKKVRVKASVKSFDVFGIPERIRHSVINFQRAGAYADQDSFDGEDTRRLFAQFLSSRVQP